MAAPLRRIRGRRLLMVEPEVIEPLDEIRLVTNWLDELERLVP